MRLGRGFPDGLRPTAVVGLSDNCITVLGINKHSCARSWLGGTSIESLPGHYAPENSLCVGSPRMFLILPGMIK